jgi:hypothetical protein
MEKFQSECVVDLFRYGATEIYLASSKENSVLDTMVYALELYFIFRGDPHKQTCSRSVKAGEIIATYWGEVIEILPSTYGSIRNHRRQPLETETIREKACEPHSLPKLVDSTTLKCPFCSSSMEPARNPKTARIFYRCLRCEQK